MQEKNGEHPLRDVAQIALLVLFMGVWVLDSFLLHHSTELSEAVPLTLRMALAAVVLVLASLVVWVGICTFYNHITEPINYVWKWYSLVLPRLKATSNRLNADLPLGPTGEFTIYAASGARTAAQLATARRVVVDLYEAQPRAFFGIMCARGGGPARQRGARLGHRLRGRR